VDTARCSTLAAQIMQSQIENLRLANWAYLTELNPQPPRTTPCLMVENLEVPVRGLLPQSARDVADRFTLRQSIVRGTGARSNMLDITLVVSWTGQGNLQHTRTYTTRYCENGTHNYYATGP
jgi:hypothetical protein